MRLIDADELIKELQRERKNGFPANENLSFYAMSSVNHAPTAFDIDNVVREIGEISYGEYGEYYYAEYKEVVDIIKKGGLNED